MFGPFCHQDWGTSVQCPVPVRTLQAVENGKYLTLAGEADTEALADAATPDGWVVKELWEFHETEDGQTVVRSNASGRYLRVGHGDRCSPTRTECGRRRRSWSRPSPPASARPSPRRPGPGTPSWCWGTTRTSTDARRSTATGSRLPSDQETLLRAVLHGDPEHHPGAGVELPVLDRLGGTERTFDRVDRARRAGTRQRRRGCADRAYNPAGRLPQTWYASDAGLLAPDDYDVIGSGWTYQYSKREHLYAFGHGLSFTTFEYGELVLTVRDDPAGEPHGIGCDAGHHRWSDRGDGSSAALLACPGGVGAQLPCAAYRDSSGSTSRRASRAPSSSRCRPSGWRTGRRSSARSASRAESTSSVWAGPAPTAVERLGETGAPVILSL